MPTKSLQDKKKLRILLCKSTKYRQKISPGEQRQTKKHIKTTKQYWQASETF